MPHQSPGFLAGIRNPSTGGCAAQRCPKLPSTGAVPTWQVADCAMSSMKSDFQLIPTVVVARVPKNASQPSGWPWLSKFTLKSFSTFHFYFYHLLNLPSMHLLFQALPSVTSPSSGSQYHQLMTTQLLEILSCTVIINQRGFVFCAFPLLF